MGVKRLETFMERYGFCTPVDIKGLIELYRQETNKKPVIVTDLLSCFFRINKYYMLAWLGGGQLKEMNEIAERFFQKFEELGAELVIFYDGIDIKSKMPDWITRRLKNQKRILKLIDELELDTWDFHDPYYSIAPRLTSKVFGIAALKSKNKCIQSILECDLEVARYAEVNDCFAILGQDTDYIIFKGARYYLSMKHFNFIDMTTLAYDRNRFAASIGLRLEELPLFASLVGNRVVDEDLLRPFHMELQGRDYLTLYNNFHNVAKFIRKKCKNFNQILPKISSLVFKTDENAKLLSESLNSYDVYFPHNDNQIDKSITDMKWLNILKLTRKQQIANKMDNDVYCVIYFSMFRYCTFEDFSEFFPPVFKLCQKLLQKIYGILLFEKPLMGIEKHQVKQLMVVDPDSLTDGYETVDAILPESHSGLESLWSEELNLDEEKFDLFFWALDIDKNIAKDPRLTIPVSSIKYLMKEGLQIHSWELHALVCSMVLLDHYTVKQLSAIPEFQLEPRPIHLYGLFSRCVVLVIFLNHACGSPVAIDFENPMGYIDGKLFQQKYRDAKASQSIEQLCENKESCITTVNDIINHLQQ